MRVLLAEDIDDSRELFRAMLEKLGHDVIEATNGKEAIKVALKKQPQLILMDLSMPEVDGFQTTAALRSMTSFGQIPIIAITAYPPNLWREKAEDAGCDAYLQKPFTAEELATVLSKFNP